MKYRLKTATVEAVQWHQHGDHPEVVRPPKGENASDLWGWVWAGQRGERRVVPGDWILTDESGEIRVCKDAIFRREYEEA